MLVVSVGVGSLFELCIFDIVEDLPLGLIDVGEFPIDGDMGIVVETDNFSQFGVEFFLSGV